MKFFSVYEILNSVIASILAGFVFGAFYKGSKTLFSFLFSFFLLLPKKIIKMFLDLEKRKYKSNKEIINNLVDFLYFFFFGITLLLSLYVMLDGEMRLYFFVFSFISFYFSSRFLGRYFQLILEFTLSHGYKILNNTLDFLFKPLNLVFKTLKNRISKLNAFINDKRIVKRSEKIMHKKLENLEKILY